MNPALNEDVLYHILRLLHAPANPYGAAPGDPRALPTADLLSAALVSKAWNIPATSLLYSSIDLTKKPFRHRCAGLMDTLRERPDLAARVLGLRFNAREDGAIEDLPTFVPGFSAVPGREGVGVLPRLVSLCLSLERVEFEGASFAGQGVRELMTRMTPIGLANVWMRECLDSLIDTQRACNITTLSLSTDYYSPHQSNLGPARHPRLARLTVAYISHRLSHFPNIRHLTLFDFMAQPCEWTISTYRLESLTLVNSLVGAESFTALLGASTPSESLRNLKITEDETPAIHDLVLALDANAEWASHLERIELHVRSGLPRTTLRRMYDLPRLREFEYEGPVEPICDELVSPGGMLRRVWVRSKDVPRAQVLAMMQPYEGNVWRIVSDGDAYALVKYGP